MTKLFIIVLILTTICLQSLGQKVNKLYLISQNNRYGYIDKEGNIIIEPKFISSGIFSEGLAPARLEGTYGYIDTNGEFIIAPKYDLALPFSNGIAKVFIEGKPFLIDKNGNILFKHNYKNIDAFGTSTFALVVTQTGRYGVINKSGNLIVDTVFQNIGSFSQGIAVVKGLNHDPYQKESTKKKYEVGVIDTLGNWIVNYGVYKEIGDFVNGYAPVKSISEDEGIIDKIGKNRFYVTYDKWFLEESRGIFNQDIAIVNIYSVDIDTVKVWSSKNRYDYKGAINSNGEIIFSNLDWDELTPFTLNRAFAKQTNDKWILINKDGNSVTTEQFDKILMDEVSNRPESLFQNGLAFVKTKKGWGAIDTNGNYLIQPRELKNVGDRHLIRMGNIILFQEDISVESEKYSYRYGFWNTENDAIVEAQFHEIDINGFDNELIQVMQDGKIGYINYEGKRIWIEKNESSHQRLNIDFMNRGYCYAKNDLEGLGGWESSDNDSKKINADIPVAPKKLQIFIDTKQKTIWEEKYDAMKLFVANTSDDTLYFDAQDSRLYLIIQAQDKNKKWKDIEYTPSSWCGNSYHTLFLAPNQLWEFATPIYEGEFQTKIRAKLLYKKSEDQQKDAILYSNEIDGYVNPGQFWNKREYYPGGLMDPNND